MVYLDGAIIKQLRERRGMTQRLLADKLNISDKTVSKWETDRGLPDISILPELASALGVSLTELMTGRMISNKNRAANLLKTGFYVCPVCGNVIQALGEGSYSCCGISLPRLESESADSAHEICASRDDGEIYVHMEHEMSRAHYVSFVAYVTAGSVQLTKLYPEQEAQCRFAIRGPGLIYACCNRDGLFVRKI